MKGKKNRSLKKFLDRTLLMMSYLVTLITDSHQASCQRDERTATENVRYQTLRSQLEHTASPPGLFTLAGGLTTDMIPSSVVIHVPIRFSPRCKHLALLTI